MDTSARDGDVNTLGKLIARQIATTGPVTVADYMATVLGHPEHGYYMTRDPLGGDGDFITAPEISQVFGELIGIWCVATWQLLGAPARFNLVEFGPGRGTLMADALRAAARMPGFIKAAAVSLVEISPVLRSVQRQTLEGYDVSWRESLEGVPEGPILVVANEFFDALPANQFVRTEAGWRERLVGQDDDGPRFVLSSIATPMTALLAPEVRNNAPVGAVAEVQPAGIAVCATLADRISDHGGAALIVDYGHAASAPGETLQAVRRHEPSDVLRAPGEADLTVHVDFAALGRAAGDKLALFGPLGQGEFLRRMGIALRMEKLLAKATGKQKKDIVAGVHRLIDDDQMGTLFKVFGLAPHGTPPLPGFET